MTTTNEYGFERAPAPVTAADRLADTYHRFPAPYKLVGQEPSGPEFARVIEICKRRDIWDQPEPGLVLQITTPYLRWYVTFNEPDADHAYQWFAEASGGLGEYFGPGDFKEFLQRIDEPLAAGRPGARL